MKPTFFNPEALPEPRGYNHGVLLSGGRILFVAGQGGLGDRGGGGGFAAQFARALAAVREVVKTAGGTVEHIGRLTIYVKNMAEYLENRRELGPIYRAEFGDHYPAMSLVEVTGFVDEAMDLEIEAIAVLP